MVDWGGRQHFFPVNVGGTKNVLEVIRKKDIPKLIYTSSTAVYGFTNTEELMSEEQSYRPEGFYQKSKLAAEEIIKEFSENCGIKATMVKLPTIVGHGDMYTSPMLLEYVKNGNMVYFGEDTNTNSFAHAEDVARLLVLAAEEFKISQNKAYNVIFEQQ